MILSGAVMHQRHSQPRYRFVYRIFSVLLNIDDLHGLHRRLWFFSHNRFNLFSFYDRDHGPGTDTPLRPWVENTLRKHGIEMNGGTIKLLTFPRVLGYVFNPISVWYCRHSDGSLRAVLCEVSNTFGEKHSYVLHEGGRPISWPLKAEKRKALHVSPFLDMNARYQFRLGESPRRLSVLIQEFQRDELLLVASLTGRLVPLSDRRLLYVAVAYPLLTCKVIALIHWQALKLWLRGARFYTKPTRPQEETS